MRSLLTLTPLPLAVSLIGCAAGPQDAPDAEAQALSTASAVVIVERTASTEGVARGDVLSARFVRVRQGALDEAALRTAGVPEVPTSGTCTTTLEAPAFTARAVDLLDVGAVSFEPPTAAKTTLLPRVMPDPAGVVSGYFYSGRTVEVLAPAARIALRATGGVDLPDGFVATVTVPREIGDLTLASTPSGLELSWDAGEEAGRDLVYADVIDRELVARCASADVGQLVIPSAVLGAVDEGTLVLHRVRREPFKARGLDAGEVRFDLARAVPFRR